MDLNSIIRLEHRSYLWKFLLLWGLLIQHLFATGYNFVRLGIISSCEFKVVGMIKLLALGSINLVCVPPGLQDWVGFARPGFPFIRFVKFVTLFFGLEQVEPDLVPLFERARFDLDA